MNHKRTYTLFAVRLVCTMLLAALVIAQTAQANSATGSVAPELEGRWALTVTASDGAPPFPGLATYARGGALTLTDSSVSPALGNVYQGTWIRTGAREFAYISLGFQYDAQGSFSNYLSLHETVRLERGGTAYNGVTTIEILDTAQNVIVTASATTHAIRVAAL